MEGKERRNREEERGEVRGVGEREGKGRRGEGKG